MADDDRLCRSIAMWMLAMRSNLRGFMPARALAIGVAGFLLIAGTGAAPAAKERRPVKAWFDAGNVCLFRLGASGIPATPHELAAALTRGCRQALILPDEDNTVAIDGNEFPSINSITIDLSDGRFRSTKKDKININNNVERNLLVRHVEVRAQPLLVHRAKLNVNLVADGAQVALERDRWGRPIMMLADARSGSLNFDVSMADAQAILLRTARDAASKYGITIERMDLKVVPETPRAVRAQVHVMTVVGFIPAGMTFKAHVTVDNAMNARLSGLTVDGDEALGPLIVGFLRPGLAKYNNEKRPLVSFPAGRVQLRDVAVRVDDSLHLTAAFGS
jgi:hypothetical protein